MKNDSFINYMKDEKSEGEEDEKAIENRASSLEYLMNPNEPVEDGKLEDEYGEDTLFTLNSLPFDLLYSIEHMLENSLMRGPLLNYPMINVKIIVCGGKYSTRRSSETAFEKLANQFPSYG